MNCPPPDDFLRDQLGELTVNASTALRAHADGCVACERERTSLGLMFGDLANAPFPSGDAFVARVETAIRSRPTPRPTAHRLPLWSVLGIAAAATAILLLVPAASRLGWHPPATDPANGTFVARGSAGLERLRADVLLVREGRSTSVSGQSLRHSDALAVRVTNLSGRVIHLMVFGRDVAGDVHWLYPAYRDARTNPSSVPIANGTKERVLAEMVQPEAPAAGRLKLVTLLSPVPLMVKDVEARLARQPAVSPVATLFPGVVANEMMAHWQGLP